ncbi:MAG TPA: hypothetical protein VM573_06465 [Actinomycetota bacterium]|jgi:hypothetical protein|nr:hypothetical protein [Actinomycetota bacterium]
MASAIVATLISVLALGLVEGMRRFYPARRTWLRLRSMHGRRAVRAMRERFEAAAERRTPRLLAAALMVLVVVWVVIASPALDKYWYETALDALPYAFVAVALLRVPAMLRGVAERMRGFEREMGEDPDREEPPDESPGAVAL